MAGRGHHGTAQPAAHILALTHFDGCDVGRNALTASFAYGAASQSLSVLTGGGWGGRGGDTKGKIGDVSDAHSDAQILA